MFLTWPSSHGRPDRFFPARFILTSSWLSYRRYSLYLFLSELEKASILGHCGNRGGEAYLASALLRILAWRCCRRRLYLR